MVKIGLILGHVISSDGIEVDKAKIDLIANLPPPTCVKDIRYFHGHVRFYDIFIQDLSKISKSFSSLPAKDVPFHFSEECLKAFTKLKEVLTTALILHPSVWDEPFELIFDAFDYAIGVVLGLCIDKKNPM